MTKQRNIAKTETTGFLKVIEARVISVKSASAQSSKERRLARRERAQYGRIWSKLRNKEALA